MQQIVLIIIFCILTGLSGYAQNKAVTKIIIPEKAGISFQKTTTATTCNEILPKTVNVAGAVNISLLHFNEQPILKMGKLSRKAVLLFTELSFSDVFENSINRIKADLVNTYDGYIPELFNDAPSLFKVKCIIPL